MFVKDWFGGYIQCQMRWQHAGAILLFCPGHHTRLLFNVENFEMHYTKLQFDRGSALKFDVTQFKEFLVLQLARAVFKQRCYCPAFGVLKS
jgi:hypothetical protein